MDDEEVRGWFLAHGWEPTPIACYDEEGVEGWRWTHDAIWKEFEELGGWDEPPAVGGLMREYAERGINLRDDERD